MYKNVLKVMMLLLAAGLVGAPGVSAQRATTTTYSSSTR
jgi:hypothetical protein